MQVLLLSIIEESDRKIKSHFSDHSDTVSRNAKIIRSCSVKITMEAWKQGLKDCQAIDSFIFHGRQTTVLPEAAASRPIIPISICFLEQRISLTAEQAGIKDDIVGQFCTISNDLSYL